MKILLPMTILLYSAASLADLSCQNHESLLMINDISNSKIKVVHSEKYPQSRVPMKLTFFGKPVESPEEAYKVQSYELLGEGEQTGLKIVTKAVITFPSSCRARVCQDDLRYQRPSTSKEITAEFGIEGNVEEYECQKI